MNASVKFRYDPLPVSAPLTFTRVEINASAPISTGVREALSCPSKSSVTDANANPALSTGDAKAVLM